MLNLSRHIKLSSEAVAAPNLCSGFDDKDLDTIGDLVWEGHEQDNASRTNWSRRTNAAMDLAMQVVQGKNFPWPGCSNIAFPLVTIASQQFHARSYPAIVQAPDLVKCQVVGADDTGKRAARAGRISVHMSYQCLEEDKAWEEQHDRMLINLPIVGCTFMKTYFSPMLGHNVSELVLAKDLVVDYYAKSIDTCNRKTHDFYIYRNEIHEKVLRETYRNVLDFDWYKQPAPLPVTEDASRKDKRTGMTAPMKATEATPYRFLEQHCDLDLDGDGYAEPYIITVEETSHCVLRIVARVEREADIERTKSGRIIRCNPSEYFTKNTFIPAPDGSIYDTGFGVLLGPLNESTNAIINSLVDAGTMSNTAGGFLGRGAKIRGGVYTFAPLEWKRVDSTGDDLHKSIFPLPVREPSAVLLNLLTLLINYVNRISGSTDAMVGENPGQNTPAETQRSMLEQGQKIYNAIFKRVWRGMKEEFKKLYILNGLYMPSKQSFGNSQFALREDYLGSPDEVVPQADPNITSDAMQVQQAMAIKQFSATTPGYDPEAVERKVLRAMKISDVDSIYPGPSKRPPGESEKIAIEKMKLEGKQMQFKHEQMMFAAELAEQQRLNSAKIIEMQAKAMELSATLQGDERDRQINAVNSMIGVFKLHNDGLKTKIDAIISAMELENERKELRVDARAVGRVENGGTDAAAATGGGDEEEALAGALV